MKTYYHGTNLLGIAGIYKSKGLSNKYGEEIGIFITEDINHAINFGQYVLILKEVDERKLTESDSEDGLFYNGVIPISCIKNVYCELFNDARVVRDINAIYSNE